MTGSGTFFKKRWALRRNKFIARVLAHLKKTHRTISLNIAQHRATFREPAKSPFCGKRKKEFFLFFSFFFLSSFLPLHVAQESHAFVNLWSDHCLVNFYLKFHSFFAEDYTSYRKRCLHVTALPLVLHGVYHLSVLVKDRQDPPFGGIQLPIDGCASVVSAIQSFRKGLSEMPLALGDDGFDDPGGNVVDNKGH